MGISGLTDRIRFHGWVAWVAGAVSGALGGLVPAAATARLEIAATLHRETVS